MAARKRAKGRVRASKKVKTLAARSLSAKKAKDVRGGGYDQHKPSHGW